MSTELFLRDGARFQVVPNDELRALWIRDEHGFIEATMHFGMADGRPSFSLAVDQLEALVAELVELHAQIGDKVGRPHLRVTVAEPPAGPDDPTDEPTDQPAMHAPAVLAGGMVPAHVPGAYPSLSCCGGPVELVASLDEPADEDDELERAALRHAGILA